MNYKKLVLVGFISAFVAVLTSVLGVAGTVIGSVISSVLYNMLSEALENPVSKASFSHDFEWEIAYVFPLVVIALIQLLLIFALLSESGFLSDIFVDFYLLIQDLANNNLYRILGIAVLIISAYPLVLKPEFVKKEHGVLLVFVGLIFLARGFVDIGNNITDIYDAIFINYDLPIAIIAFLILSFVIIRILMSAHKSHNEVKSKDVKTFNPESVHESQKPIKHQTFTKNDRHKTIRVKDPKRNVKPVKNRKEPDVTFKKDIDVNMGKDIAVDKDSLNINTSSGEIQFESNDLLDDYKK